MMRTALVTGAAGFIGSALMRALVSAGFRVHGLDRAPPAGQVHALAADWTIADLGDGVPAAVPAPEVVFHCAGGSTVGASFDDPAADYRANVRTTEALLGWLAGSPSTRVVLVSSAAVYGMQPSTPIAEDAEPRPISPYGKHKVVAEGLLRASGLHSAVVRLFSVYGPGLRKQLLWDAARKISRGAPFFGGDGSEVRDWLHVDDAAALLIKAADAASPSCPVFNGGTGVPVTVHDILWLLSMNLRGLEILKFSGEGRQGDPPVLVADVRAARATGWSPKVSLEVGIPQYAAWFQSVAQ